MRITRVAVMIVCGALVLAGWPAGEVRAEDWEFGALAYIVFGTIIVDTGVTIANLVMINSHTAKPGSGWVGVGAGIFSYSLVAFYLIDENEIEAGFPLVMGTLGTAALGTGIVVLRTAGPGDDGEAASPRLTIEPCLVRGEGERLEPGISMRLSF